MQSSGKEGIDNTLSRLASIGEMSAGIAHEVRNPLTAVKGFLQLLQKESPHRYLDIASSELERALATLQNLLQVSKPDLDSESYAPVNLCAELESLLYLFQDQIYRVEIVRNFRDTDAIIYGKKNQLKKAFFNLLKNSFEAIPDKGKIWVEHYREDNSIFVSISDSGIGIPKEKLQLIGTPFYTTKDDGTGMGMAQVYASIYDHGGNITIKSTEGIGTKITIQFPLEGTHLGGVKKMDLEYIKNLNLKYQPGKGFSEFFIDNEQEFYRLLKSEASNTFEWLSNTDKFHEDKLLAHARQLVILLNEGTSAGILNMARERGVEWAQLNLPIIVKLEWIQSLRKTLWDCLAYYFLNEGIQAEETFVLERRVNYLMDTFIIHFFSNYTQYKEEVMVSQRDLIEELTVPVIPISNTMAVLPLIGTLDTYRAKKIQERVLQEISNLRIRKIVFDLSGVAYMDTAVVSHLFRIIDGVGLLGSQAILTGIRPEIANTMIELGIVLTERVTVKSTLQQAIAEEALV